MFEEIVGTSPALLRSSNLSEKLPTNRSAREFANCRTIGHFKLQLSLSCQQLTVGGWIAFLQHDSHSTKPEANEIQSRATLARQQLGQAVQ